MRQAIYNEPGFSERAVEIIESLDLVNWNVICIGVAQGWLPRKYATKFAAQCLSECSEDQFEDLSWLAKFGEDLIHDIEPLLELLSDNSESIEQRAHDTWRLVLIMSVLEADGTWEDKGWALFLVSAAFDDPEDMRGCFPVGSTMLDENNNYIDPLDAAARLAEALKAKLTCK